MQMYVTPFEIIQIVAVQILTIHRVSRIVQPIVFVEVTFIECQSSSLHQEHIFKSQRPGFVLLSPLFGPRLSGFLLEWLRMPHWNYLLSSITSANPTRLFSTLTHSPLI
jgi:hypothetical protein